MNTREPIDQDIKNLYYLVDYEENLQDCYNASLRLAEETGTTCGLTKKQLSKSIERLNMYSGQLATLLKRK